MITQSTDVRGALGARRRARAMREASHDDVMHASPFGLSLGIGLGIGSALDDNNAFSPAGVPGLVALFDCNVASKLTYGTTFKASGTVPPVVTATYGTVSVPTAIRIEIQSTTTFRWGPENDGTTANFGAGASGVTIPAGSSIALGSTGVTAVFPVGTYGATQVYQTTLASVTSVNSADVLAQATAAKQPLFLKLMSAVGTPATNQYGWKTDAVDDILNCTTIDMPSPTVGTPTQYWGVMRPEINSGNFDTVYSAAAAGSAQIAVTKGFLNFNHAMTNGAASGNILTSNVFGRHSAYFSNTTGDTLYWRNVTPVTGAATGGANPSAGICFGARGGGAGDASTFSADSWCLVGIWSQSLAASFSALDSYVTARFGAGLV